MAPSRENECPGHPPLSVLDWRVERMMACLVLSILLNPLLRAAQQDTKARDITVRLINVKSGKPLSEVPVTMFSWNGPPTFRPDNIPKSNVAVHTTTDAEGRAVFRLPEPLPEHLGFDVGEPWNLKGCWRRDAFPPETVLRSGIVADYIESKCGKLKKQVSAKPGEFVILERKFSLWDRMRQELP